MHVGDILEEVRGRFWERGAMSSAGEEDVNMASQQKQRWIKYYCEECKAWETREMFEVVAGIGVGHHDVLAAGSFDPGDEGCAVAADRDVHDARAFCYGNFLRPIAAAVVGDDDFAGDA